MGIDLNQAIGYNEGNQMISLALGATKMLTESQIERMKEIGNEWKKGEHHRIYFNNLEERLGLDICFYKSGNVMSATLDGEHISNSECRRILGRLYGAKFYYDVIAGKFQSQYDGDLHDDERARIFNSIKKEIGLCDSE